MNFFDYEVKHEMNLVSELVQKIRWFKQYFQIPKELFTTSNVLIATYGNKLEKYKDFISTSTKANAISFVSIHDIHRFDNHLCYKICSNVKQNSESEEDTDSSSSSSSSQSDERTVFETKNSINDCYVLFDIDSDAITQSMTRSGLRFELIEQKSNELNQYKCNNFHKNFWRTKSMLNK